MLRASCAPNVCFRRRAGSQTEPMPSRSITLPVDSDAAPGLCRPGTHALALLSGEGRSAAASCAPRARRQAAGSRAKTQHAAHITVWGRLTFLRSKSSGAWPCRPGTDVQALLRGEGTVLHELRDHVLVVVDPVTNALSSTAVRTQVAQVMGTPLLGDQVDERYKCLWW